MHIHRLTIMLVVTMSLCLGEAGITKADDGQAEKTIVVNPGESIQQAIERSADAGGGIVQLAAGIHVLDASLWMRDGVTLQGCGPATELRAGPHLDDVAIGSNQDSLENVALVDFALVGPGELPQMSRQIAIDEDPPGIMGIFMNFGTGKGRNVRLERLRITRWTRMGVHLKGVTGLTIRGCDVNCSSAHNSLYHNVYLRRTSDVRIIDNLFRNSPVGNGFQASFSDNVLIQGNRALHNAGHGIRVAAAEHVSIQDNTVVGNRGGAGIWLNIEKNRPCRDIQVLNNVVRGNTNSGLAVRNTQQCLVEGNDILGNGTDVSFRNARDTTLRQNRFATTGEEKTNSVTLEDNVIEAP